jgi:hypothetical protein
MQSTLQQRSGVWEREYLRKVGKRSKAKGEINRIRVLKSGSKNEFEGRRQVQRFYGRSAEVYLRKHNFFNLNSFLICDLIKTNPSIFQSSHIIFVTHTFVTWWGLENEIIKAVPEDSDAIENKNYPRR